MGLGCYSPPLTMYFIEVRGGENSEANSWNDYMMCWTARSALVVISTNHFRFCRNTSQKIPIQQCISDYFLSGTGDWSKLTALFCKGRRNRWVDCYSKWETNAFVLLFLVWGVSMYCGSHPTLLETTEKTPIDFSNSLIRLSTHKRCHCLVLLLLGVLAQCSPPALRYIYLISPCKQWFTCVMCNLLWQKEVTCSWTWREFEAGFLVIRCACSG